MRVSTQKKEIVKNIMDSVDQGLTLHVRDNMISMMNGGKTRIRKIDDGLYGIYSSGQGWSDQVEEHYGRDYTENYLNQIHLIYLRESILK